MDLDDMSPESLRLWIATQLLAADFASNQDAYPGDTGIKVALDTAERLMIANRHYEGVFDQ